ncbi:hypothetical protein Glove_109g227 [Diversispora epigaea]|uniref:Uncharacterized protein n=1 Tax=Diversispora epigaea TaxID=1348612 RepID=A0A397JBK9_9GLOM|nr:hypothetical protein Glove_109g227 [Diversispora epigaea]
MLAANEFELTELSNKLETILIEDKASELKTQIFKNVCGANSTLVPHKTNSNLYGHLLLNKWLFYGQSNEKFLLQKLC